MIENCRRGEISDPASRRRDFAGGVMTSGSAGGHDSECAQYAGKILGMLDGRLEAEHILPPG